MFLRFRYCRASDADFVYRLFTCLWIRWSRGSGGFGSGGWTHHCQPGTTKTCSRPTLRRSFVCRAKIVSAARCLTPLYIQDLLLRGGTQSKKTWEQAYSEPLIGSDRAKFFGSGSGLCQAHTIGRTNPFPFICLQPHRHRFTKFTPGQK